MLVCNLNKNVLVNISLSPDSTFPSIFSFVSKVHNLVFDKLCPLMEKIVVKQRNVI